MKIKVRIALFIDEFANDEPGMLTMLQIGSIMIPSWVFSPNVEKQIKYTMMRVNKEAMYIIPFMSEFEMLSMTKKADNINDPDIEIILNILDKDKSIGILFEGGVTTVGFLLLLYIYYLKN
jgi:hypothetical protein